MTDRLGQQLGNYRLIRLLGRGGFAEVYLGEHLRLNTQAAIKVLHTSLEDDDVEGFLREAQIVARLKHQHIVRVFDFDVENHTPFLAMDYLPNGNVRRSHPKGTPLPLATIVSYVTQVASALQYAHNEKLIHRDIKPENMLLDRDNTLVLSDFGIALMSQSSRYQSTQEVAGTAAYMAPEQFQGHPRRASDQYALGVVVYEWLTGGRPFHGSFSEIASQHLFVAPPPLRGKIATISPDVEQVVLTALSKDPDKRFESVKAFAMTLEQASRFNQPHSIILSQAPTIPGQPLKALTMTSPAVPLSQQTVISSPREGVQTLPTPPDQSRQVVSSSRLQDRSEPVRQGLSRRAIILGLGVAGLAIAVGSLTLLVSSQEGHPSVVSSQTSTTTPQTSPGPTLTPIPSGTLLYSYRGHTDIVNTVAWSPDGKRIASGGNDHTVQVWDAANGGNLYTYRGHSNNVHSVAWSPDGKRIASGSGDHTVQVWDAANGGNLYTYRGHSNVVRSVAWSPDGRRIASGSNDDTAQVWDAANGGNLYTYHGHADSYVAAVAWSPDGRRIASGGNDHTAQVWDAANGGNLYTYRGHADIVYAVPWSPDGMRIASGSADSTVQVWDAANGGNAFIYHGHAEVVQAVVWSPNGQRITSGGRDTTVQVWDAVDGGHVFTYRGHSSVVEAVAWSPDGGRVASGSDDKTVQVWGAG